MNGISFFDSCLPALYSIDTDNYGVLNTPHTIQATQAFLKGLLFKSKTKIQTTTQEKTTCMYLCLKEKSSWTQSLDISLPKH